MQAPTAPIPILPGQTEQQRNKMRAERQKAQVDNFLWQTCINCENWDKDKELCEKWGVRPPAKVIVNGCDDWFVDIPF